MRRSAHIYIVSKCLGWEVRPQRGALTSALLTLSLILSLCMPMFVHAEAPRTLEVSPAVIDEKAKQRDIIKESITITNTSQRPLNLFPAVEDVNVQNGDQTFAYGRNADERSDSLANWIELSRGTIFLQPGESKTIPFVIHVNMNAVPGLYHAAVTFTDGGTRDETNNKNPDGLASVNVEVQADIRETMELQKFSVDRFVFSGDDVLFNYIVNNNGNQDLVPSGDIRIYDRRGEEVATVDVNKDGKPIGQGQSAQLASVWSAVQGFGQFKAMITVNYGKAQTASVQDTMYFWIIPWKQILGILTATIITMVILALYFHRWFEERHLNKLAIAGLLKLSPSSTAVIAQIPHFAPPPPRPKPPVPPPKIEVAKEPKEHLIIRVVENIVIAWRLFTTFKQRGRLTPSDIANERALAMPKRSSVPQPHSAPVHAPQSAANVSHHVAGVEAEWHSSRGEDAASGETIDLKSFRPSRLEVVNEGHVVNLKRSV